MKTSFGAGASDTLLGSSGSGNFMTRVTGVLAVLFFIISLALGSISANKYQKGSKWENLSQSAKTEQVTALAALNSDVP